MAIVDCSSLSGGGLSCAQVNVKGVGRFFMQQQANLTGGTKSIDVEFAGLIAPVPTTAVALYR